MSETQIVTPDQIASAAKASSEVLPGYTLERRIGSGGFGEVWKAAAPGGLEKAVKILYGHFDEEQAETELKSLERVRSLHHPFLLNIERIEIALGRLIIVTELAEESLEDRFKACRKLDWPGIPYEELLGYLRDAADALDFMSTKHGLQHLDVKPDNLLLQSGHVKVADFGLTKDLSQSQVSLVGAFTPLYAPPELYEGQPTPSSDQYSLAIVYQAMLTGTPPFLGRTAAQLASQHLSSQPNLQPLPMMDRPAVARALSKNPDARFSSCGEFLEELYRRRTGERERKPRVVSPQPIVPDSENAVLSGSTEFVNTFVESRLYKNVGVEPAQAAYRPTLVLGLGGMAGRVLCELKQRIQGRFGAEARLPGLGLLYLDSDTHAVARATRCAKGALSYHETLAIPLRSPQDYKTNDIDFSDWLSRRWLFNIPRSRQVQGMRALGRLAFADHQKTIRQRIREHLTRLISEESLAIMQEQTGLAFEKAAPNVLVLASITGGTGGGTALDLGYMLRDELSGMALEGADIEGLMLFGTDCRDGDRDVEIANALCLLRELDHFTRACYPGDPTCNLPEIPDPPFHNNYLVHLGEYLDESRLTEGLSHVAEYLYRATFTPARAFFQQFRNASAAEAAPNEVMHTFGVRRIDPEPSEQQQIQSQELIRQLLWSWIQPLPETEFDFVKRMTHPWCDAKFDALGWKLKQLEDRGREFLRGEEIPQVEAWLTPLLSELPRDLPKASKKTEKMLGDLIRQVDQAFEDRSPSEDVVHPQRWLEGLHAQLQEQANESVKWFQDALWAAMDYWPHPVESANFVIENTLTHLEACRQQFSRVIQQLTSDLVNFSNSTGNLPQTSEELPAFLSRYAELRFCYETHRALLGFVESIRDSLGTWPSVLNQLRQTLGQWLPTKVDAVGESSGTQANANWGERFDQELRRKGQRQFKRLSQAVEQSEAEWFAHIQDEAQEFVLFCLTHPCGSKGENQSAPSAFWASAKPQLDGVGGVRSAVLVVPNADSPDYEAHAKSALGDCVTVLTNPKEPLFLCCETRNLTLSAIQNSISDVREDLKEVASRLHTRIDVKWDE